MGHVMNKRVGFWVKWIECTVRQGNNLEWRAGSFCVLVDGDDKAAAARGRIAKVRVRDGSIRNDPTVLPEPVNKV